MKSRCSWILSALLLAPWTLAGCGSNVKTVPVSGKVKYTDGTPVTKGVIVFQNSSQPSIEARGVIQPDGSFTLTTETEGDGAPPGTYKVYFADSGSNEALEDNPNTPQDESLPQPLFGQQYMSPDTSGITKEVTGASNFDDIQVGKP